MADVNTVLTAWECCNPLNRRCFVCPYENICFHDSFDRVAIADMVRLLKEQKAEIERLKEQKVTTVKPHYIDKYSKHFICGVECGACHREISSKYNYCPWCNAKLEKDGE